MKQNFFEKLGMKFVIYSLSVLLMIIIIQSFLQTSDYTILSQNTFYFVLLQLIGVFFLVAFMKILFRFTLNLSDKYDFLLSFFCLTIITMIQLFAIKYLEIRPIEDLNKVTNMAIDIVNGKKFENNNTYFSMYTNNIPFTLYLAKYFELCIKLGIRNYTLVGSLLGIFCINSSLIFTSLILKKLKSQKVAVLFLCFNIFNPLIYLWGSFFYTTIVALPFMMLSIYLIIELPKEKNLIYFLLKVLLLTATLYVGTQIRATTIFVLVGAILLYSLKLIDYLRNRGSFSFILTWLKKGILGVILSLFCILILQSSYQKMLSNYMHADYSQTAFPASHWIMMGLSGNGGFQWLDEQGTLSQPTKDAKVAYNKAEIYARINELGISGLGTLALEKLSYTWSDSSHDYTTIMRACHNYTNIHKYILGNKRDAFLLYSQIFHITMLGLVLVKLIFCIKKKSTPKDALLLLVLLGGIVFHLLWESNPKYSLNFIMLLLYLAVDAWDDILQLKPLSESFDRTAFHLGIGCMLLTTIASFLLYPQFTKENTSFQDLVQGQLVSNKDRIHGLENGSYFYQSFDTSRAFDTISIQLLNDSTNLNATYLAELLDENENVLYAQNFSPKKMQEIETQAFHFTKVVPSTSQTYYLRITALSVTKDESVAFCMSNKPGYDVFPHGALYIDDTKLDADLTFTVTHTYKDSFTHPFYYFTAMSILLLFEFLICAYYRKQLHQLNPDTQNSPIT